MRTYLLLACFMLLSIAIVGQQTAIAYPRVSFAEVPLYPPGAARAHVEGIVKFRIRTDGHKVSGVTLDGKGIPVLAEAAEANLRTWRFDIHEPTSFVVTYRYRLVSDIKVTDNNSHVSLSFPTYVEIDQLRWSGTVDSPAVVR